MATDEAFGNPSMHVTAGRTLSVGVGPYLGLAQVLPRPTCPSKIENI